jgi:hypothetical protein
VGLWRDIGDTGKRKVSGRGDLHGEVTMEASTAARVNGHGVGVHFALEDAEGGMGRCLEDGGKR